MKIVLSTLVLISFACDDHKPHEALLDSGALDSGALDSGALDSGALDSGALDGGTLDSGALDGGTLDSGALDGGNENKWAPWPPKPGDAGLSLIWTIDGEPPSAWSCAAVNLAEVELTFLHPIVDFDTWTAPELIDECSKGEIRLDPSQGLAPGRYRFKAILKRPDGSEFTHEPGGETFLISGEVTSIVFIDIAQASKARAR